MRVFSILVKCSFCQKNVSKRKVIQSELKKDVRICSDCLKICKDLKKD